MALAPKAFDLLAILVGTADRLLKKEEFIEQLWPGVFVEEVNLAQNISALRRALGGDGREAFIQTVARHRLPVRRRRSRPLGGTPWRRRPPNRERLLVLPFRMLKPDPELDFLAFSLPDALTVEFSALDSIIVRSSLVAAQFAGDAPDLARIAREAQVDFVVTGTLLRGGRPASRLRATRRCGRRLGAPVAHRTGARRRSVSVAGFTSQSALPDSLSGPLTLAG